MTTSETPAILLATDHLCLSYGPLRVVDDLSLNVRAGEIYGFLGRNGAGKTSTIRMLMGIIRPDSGQIEIMGFRGQRIGITQKRQIGYVSQEQFFYPWMTCSGLGRFVAGFYPKWDRQEFGRLLKALSLPPQRRVSHLSGGMKVKLALALALAHRPEVLILDEPTAGLDPATRREFLEIIRNQARSHNRTTFFSTHLIDEVERVADRVGIINQGKLLFEGTLEELHCSVKRVQPKPISTPNRQPSEPELPSDSSPAYAGTNESPLPTDSAQPVPEAELVEPADPIHVPAVVAVPDTSPPTPAEPSLAALAAEFGFTYLRDDFNDSAAGILFGQPSQWELSPFDDDQISKLSLEDIVVAMTAEATRQL